MLLIIIVLQKKTKIVIPLKYLRYEILGASFQGVKRLFVLAYFITTDDVNNEASIKNNRKYFLKNPQK